MLVIPSDDKTQLVYRNDDRRCQYGTSHCWRLIVKFTNWKKCFTGDTVVVQLAARQLNYTINLGCFSARGILSKDKEHWLSETSHGQLLDMISRKLGLIHGAILTSGVIIVMGRLFSLWTHWVSFQFILWCLLVANFITGRPAPSAAIPVLLFDKQPSNKHCPSVGAFFHKFLIAPNGETTDRIKLDSWRRLGR